VIARYCWSVTTLRLRGSVFTEPLPRSGLHNPVVPLLVRVLLRNGCFCCSTALAWDKYATILKGPSSLTHANIRVTPHFINGTFNSVTHMIFLTRNGLIYMSLRVLFAILKHKNATPHDLLVRLTWNRMVSTWSWKHEVKVGHEFHTETKALLQNNRVSYVIFFDTQLRKGVFRRCCFMICNSTLGA
jgi:hypothetical protein